MSISVEQDVASGIVRSRVFPGWWLAANALLAGLQFDDHAAFVRRLKGER